MARSAAEWDARNKPMSAVEAKNQEVQDYMAKMASAPEHGFGAGFDEFGASLNPSGSKYK